MRDGDAGLVLEAVDGERVNGRRAACVVTIPSPAAPADGEVIAQINPERR